MKRSLRCLASLITLFLGFNAALSAQHGNAQNYDFSGGICSPGWISISPENIYSSASGFGFEPGSRMVLKSGSVTSTNPFYFSVKLPEGNYRVTVTLANGSVTTIKAESRRLMLEHLAVSGEESARRTFIINTHMPIIPATNLVHLSSEMRQTKDWDDKLTLEFNDTHPLLKKLQIERADLPTLFLLGDSTVCDFPVEPWNSWGQMLTRFFKPDIAVDNLAVPGDTVAAALRDQRFAKAFSSMKPGDYLFVQFGHNDMKDKNPDALEHYKLDYHKVIAETRARGGIPVLVTSMERKVGLKKPTLKGYPDAVREIANVEHCPLIDLNQMSLVFYRALGTNLDRAFVDGTHHNNFGSYELAKCVIKGIQQGKLPLMKLIVDDFDGFEAAHPDSPEKFDVPPSPGFSLEKPLGN